MILNQSHKSAVLYVWPSANYNWFRHHGKIGRVCATTLGRINVSVGVWRNKGFNHSQPFLTFKCVIDSKCISRQKNLDFGSQSKKTHVSHPSN